MAIAFGGALLLLLASIGAGPTIALLPRRWRPWWLALSPTVGLCVLVVGSEIPSAFAASRAYGPPLIGLSLALSLALVWLFRRRLRPVRWLPLLTVAPLLVAGVWPILREGILTTLAFRNHDYLFYTLTELQLIKLPQPFPEYIDRNPAELFASVARLGGWRMGLPFVSANLCALFRLEPHQVDGTLWAVFYSLFPTTLAAAHAMVVPRSSKGARLALLLLASGSGTALSMLRIGAISHLVGTLLLVLIWALGWRALRGRESAPRALVALLIAALASVLHESAPFLLMVGLSIVVALVATGSPPTILARRLGWAALAVACMPMTLWRAVTASHNMIRAAFGHWVGQELVVHVPLAFGMSTGAPGTIMPVTPGLQIVSVCGGLAGVALLVQWHRLARPLRILFSTLAASTVAVVALLSLTGINYLGLKLVMSFHPFALIAAAAILDRLAPTQRRLTAVLLGTLLVGNAAWIWGYATQKERPEAGIRAEHLALREALRQHPGLVHLIGNTEASTPDPEHNVGYILATLERPGSFRFKTGSYFGHVQFEPRPFALDGRPELVVVWRPAPFVNAMVRGRLLFESREFALYDLSGKGSYAADLIFDEDQWYSGEIEPVREFRWAPGEATLTVERVVPGVCLSLDVRLPPGREASEILATVSGKVERFPITVDWTRISLALPTYWQHVVLHSLARQAVLEEDARPLSFAVSALSFDRCAKEVAAPEKPNLPPPETPVEFLGGWHGLESEEGRYFRWSAGESALRVTVAATGSCFAFDVRSGPTSPARELRFAGGAETFRRPVSFEWSHVELPLPPGVHTLALQPDLLPPKPSLDGRILAFALANFRVAACK